MIGHTFVSKTETRHLAIVTATFCSEGVPTVEFARMCRGQFMGKDYMPRTLFLNLFVKYSAI